MPRATCANAGRGLAQTVPPGKTQCLGPPSTLLWILTWYLAKEAEDGRQQAQLAPAQLAHSGYE